MDSPIVDDLAAEQAVLDELVCALDEDQWETPSPAVGWDVRGEIAQLAFFDEVAVADAPCRCLAAPSEWQGGFQ